MDDQMKTVLLRELQRFTEAQMRQAIAQEEIAAALHRIGVKMKPSHVTAADMTPPPMTLAQSMLQAETVAAARTAAEHAEDEIRRRVDEALTETQATVDKALREDELGKLQAGAPSPVDGRR
jgi:hypothetical protein